MPRSAWAREPWLLSLRVWSLCSATGEATTVRGLRTAKKQKQTKTENSPVVQWIGIRAVIAEGPGSIPDQGIKIHKRASLVAQWLRVCLPIQGTRVRAPVLEDPTCCGAAGPVSHGR